MSEYVSYFCGMRNIISSKTTHPNTPESDNQQHVLHDVVVKENDKLYTMTFMAECPVDAQNIVRNMLNEEYQSYLK